MPPMIVGLGCEDPLTREVGRELTERLRKDDILFQGTKHDQ